MLAFSLFDGHNRGDGRYHGVGSLYVDAFWWKEKEEERERKGKKLEINKKEKRLREKKGRIVEI